MRTLYLDIFSGISGDMFLGAMLDLGLDFQTLERELRKLGVEGYHLHAKRADKANIVGIKFDVHLTDHHDHEHEHEHDNSHAHGHDHEHHEVQKHAHSHQNRSSHDHDHSHAHAHEHEHEHSHSHSHQHEHSRDFSEIKELIGRSTLSAWVKQKSLAIFQRIAVAEGKVHGQPPDQVHFHEVGAVDSIVDIVGACIALELLGKPRVLAAPVVEGTGWVQCAHGRFPVPTTATLEILGARGIALTQCEEPHELVTPTGAALLAELAEAFGPMEGLVASKIGYGLGTRDNKTRPNVLRAVLGETALRGADSRDWEIDAISVLETNLDDCSAEILGHFVESAMSAGALDVFHTAIQMKKNRPGLLLTVLCGEIDADRFTEMLLRETSAFGVRRQILERRKLKRDFAVVPTAYGDINIKLGKLNGAILHATPEFESCKALASQANVSLKQVYEAAHEAIHLLKLKSQRTSTDENLTRK
jgi:pyridinium-3,5-bisthiocarboxylic acid mononucleotide nickel chelatase